MSENGQSKTAYELIGGQGAVSKAVEILYEKLFSDGNCRQFFERTDMRKLKAHQVQFIGYALGNSKKYQGKSMVEAHQNLKGLQMTHFDAVGQYLKEALEELEVNEDLISAIMSKVEGLRPQFQEAVDKAGKQEGEDSRPAFERIGGESAVKAAVELLYEKLLSDGNCRQFFEGTDMRRLKSHQVQFIRFALGGSDQYKGKDMVSAHKNLKGLQIVHFEAVARHLAESLRELDVPRGLVDEVLEKVETLRPQFEQAVAVANQ